MTSPTLLTTFLVRSTVERPEHPAIVDRSRSMTYQQTYSTASAIAKNLRRNGVSPGDRVIQLMANSVGFCVSFWGIVLAGAVAVPVNPETKRGKLAWIIKDCTPHSVIVDEPSLAIAAASAQEAGVTTYFLTHHEAGLMGSEWISLDADGGPSPDLMHHGDAGAVIDRDLAAIIYTSGSTGDPKGVMLTHLNVTTAARSVSDYLGYRPDDVIFCAIPLTFDYGLHQLTMATLVGATLIIETGFSQPLFALARLVTDKATIFPIVPTMVPLIETLADRFDLSHVRCLTSTAAALHATNIDKLSAIFPNATLFSMYGLTECHRCTYLDPAQLPIRKSSVGKAIPNTELWVVDAVGNRHFHSAVGELVIRGSTVMKGYWNNPIKTAEKLRLCPETHETVLYTGDTCRLDEEGFLYFVARADDILKVGGHKVAPTEIESVLLGHQAVSQVSVIGVDHPAQGQRAIAFVALRHQKSATPDELLDWCRERLEPQAVPARIVIIDEFARNPNGKIDKNVLRDQLAEAM
ncbi:acyl--CoA ligase (plasmid) [Rhizobium sp. NIBRBAC000502774]|nr:acyl--CoA ligase [Rhizobium sp. NIBRBAC000502774]